MAGDFFKALRDIGYNIDDQGHTPEQQALLPKPTTPPVTSDMSPQEAVETFAQYNPQTPDTVLNQRQPLAFGLYNEPAGESGQAQEPTVMDYVIPNLLFGGLNAFTGFMQPEEAYASQEIAPAEPAPKINSPVTDTSLPSKDELLPTYDELMSLNPSKPKPKDMMDKPIVSDDPDYDPLGLSNSATALPQAARDNAAYEESKQRLDDKMQELINSRKNSVEGKKLQAIVNSDSTTPLEKRAAQGYLDEMGNVTYNDVLSAMLGNSEYAPMVPLSANVIPNTSDKDALKEHNERVQNVKDVIDNVGSVKKATFKDILEGIGKEHDAENYDDAGEPLLSKQGIELDKLKTMYEDEIYDAAMKDAAYKQLLKDAGYGAFTSGFAAYGDLGNTLDVDDARRDLTRAIFGLDDTRKDLEIEGLKDIYIENGMVTDDMSPEEALEAIVNAHWGRDRIIDKALLATSSDYLNSRPISGDTAAGKYAKYWGENGDLDNLLGLLQTEGYGDINGKDWTKLNNSDVAAAFAYGNAIAQANKGKLFTNEDLQKLQPFLWDSGDYAGMRVMDPDIEEEYGYSAYDWATPAVQRDYTLKGIGDALYSPNMVQRDVQGAGYGMLPIDPYQDYGVSNYDMYMIDELANAIEGAYSRAGQEKKVGRNPNAAADRK